MKLVYAFLLLLFSISLEAQLMEWGVAQKLISRNFFCKAIGNDNEGYYYLRCKKPDFKNDIIIEKYSRNLILLWSKNIPNDKLNDGLLEVLLTKNKLILVTVETNNSNGFTELAALTINPEGELSSHQTDLFRIKSSAFYNDDASDRFIFRMNEGKTQVGVCYVTQAEKKYASLNYFLFDQGLVTIASGGYPYTVRTDQFFINDYILKDTSIYALISYNETRKTSDDIYFHDVIDINTAAKTFRKTNLKLENKIQSDLGIILDTTNKKLILTGFYSEKKSTSAAGVALFQMPLDTPENYTASYKPFPKELLSKIIGERASERTKEMEDFVVHRIVPRSDGGLLLIAECFYIEKQPYNTYTSGIQGPIPQQSVIRSVYNYDEVLVFSLDADATIDWWQVITKNQNSINDEGYNLSIATLVKKDMIYVYFNLGYRNSNDIMEYSISSTGKMRNKVLFKSTGYYIDFTPRQCTQIGNGSLLMPIIKDKKFNLLKLTY